MNKQYLLRLIGSLAALAGSIYYIATQNYMAIVSVLAFVILSYGLRNRNKFKMIRLALQRNDAKTAARLLHEIPNPETMKPEDKAVFQYFWAMVQLELQEWNAAQDLFADALGYNLLSNHDTVVSHLNMAICQINLKNIDESQKHLQNAITADIDNKLEKEIAWVKSQIESASA